MGMKDRETVIEALQYMISGDCTETQFDYTDDIEAAIALLKEQEAVVHPEPSCEMTYITNCCCDLCGVQLIREDNFCRCCGKRIEWEGR